MQNILILADGVEAEHFIERIGQKRIADNRYTVVMPRPFSDERPLPASVSVHRFDPTSYIKLRRMLHEERFNVVFIVMEDDEEGQACLANIRAVDPRLQVVFFDPTGRIDVEDDSAIHLVSAPELIASRLYDQLPNVPLVAQYVGMGQGEIMEVLVPYGSSFAYRHVGSIAQVKWRIAAIYRKQKLLLPTNATMIRPQDTLLVIGKPQVLTNLYYRIGQKEGRFPEPFGRDLYLLLDPSLEGDATLACVQEAIDLREQTGDAQLYIRVIHPGDFAQIETIRSRECETIHLQVSYGDAPPEAVLIDDMMEHDIGMVMMAPSLFGDPAIAEELLGRKKLVFLFGESPISRVERLVVLMGSEPEMESISSTLFYASETWGLESHVCWFDPEGEFADRQRVIEHYETLARIFESPVTIERQTLNPIRALEAMDPVLHIVPFTAALLEKDWLTFFSTRLSDYLLDSPRHPKLLIPAEEG